MSSLYKSYKRRMVFGILSLLVIILAVVNVITYTMIKNVMEYQFGLSTQGTAMTVSLLISQNPDEYRRFVGTKDVTSEYYRRMQDCLTQIKKSNNIIKFIYTTNRLDETRTEYILDAEPVGSENYSAPGDIEEENAVTLQAFNTRQPVMLPPTASAFGILLGSSVPILDKNGDVFGVVGVEIDSSSVFSALRNWFIVLIIMCGLLLTFIGFLLSRVSGLLLEPMLKDKLTGAYNKRYSDTLLQQHIDEALKLNHELSILMLDLDHFKKVNDTYGHQFGDFVLSDVAGRIGDCLRKDDFIVRYGGEEFLVLLFNLGAETAAAVAERIRKAIESHEIFNKEENRGIKITISIGVAGLRHRKLSGAELVDDADKALYKAKETRNAVAVLTE